MSKTQVLGPSPEVLSRIENSVLFTKKDSRLRRAAAGALAALTLFLTAAGAAAVVAFDKSVEAAKQQRLALDATRKAEEQTTLAEQADGRRRTAEEQAKVAEKALGAARIKTNEAIAEQRRAESQRNRAELLTKARVALDTPDPLAAMVPITQSIRVADGSDARLLLAEAYNAGIPNLLPRIFTQIRQFRVDPLGGDQILVVGATGQNRALKNTLALLDLKAGTTKVTNDFLYLAATFSPDSRHIYAIAITRYDRGPNEGMDTKIDKEISLLRYDMSLHLEQRTPFDVIQTTSNQRLPGERERTNWDIRDVQDLRFSPSGNRLIFAGYAAQDYYRNLSNAMPFHLRSWIDFPGLRVHHSVDTEHELSSFNQYRGRVVLLDDLHLVVDGIAEVYTIDMNTGARVLLGKHTSGVGDLAVNHSGTSIAAIGGDNRVTVFQKTPSGWRSVVETLQGDSSCDRVAFFDEDKIAVARGNGSVSLLWMSPKFDDESLHLEGELTWRVSREKSVVGHTARISVISVSPDGRWIATAGEDRTVRVWSPYEYSNRVFYGSKRGITDVQFSHDSKQVYVSDADGLLRVFAVEDSHRFTLAVEPGSKRHEEMVPDSAWDEGGGLVQAILREHLGFIRDLTQTTTGHLVASTYDRRRTIWDADYHLINTVRTPPETMAEAEDRSSEHITAKVVEEIADLDARDGRRLNNDNKWADSSDNLALHLHALPLPPEPKGKTSAGMFSPDGRWFLLFDYQTQYLRIWDTSSLAKPAASLEIVYGSFRWDDYGAPQSDRYLRFSPSSNYAAFPISFDGEALCRRAFKNVEI